jgi:choline dehydrogenase-like flavoprotein
VDAYDVIIIGTGAGGGTLARHLAPSGKRILLLERGDWLPREPQNWLAQDVFVDNRYVSEDTWYDDSGKPFQPQIHYFVGGATKLYGAALYRLRAEDFGELEHHDGVSPAWPISYDDLEPYYTLAEQHYEVHGARGEDPTEPHASAPYPFPAVSHEPRIQQLSDDLEAAAFHPFHAPCGIRLNESNMPYSACVRCANCDGFVCAVHGKSDAEVLGVRPALEHPNVELVTNAKAVQLDTNEAGTAVTEVVVEREGETMTYPGELVVLACGAANTAKLLLTSATDKHPKASRTARTRSGATTCSTTARQCSRSRARRTRPSFRRRSDVPRRASRRDEARAAVDAREGREARGRLLALHRGPADAREPRHGRQGRQADP